MLFAGKKGRFPNNSWNPFLYWQEMMPKNDPHVVVDYLRRFVPDLEDIVSFEELVKEENLSEESQQASKWV